MSLVFLDHHNYCRHEIWNDHAYAKADFHCSNWGSALGFVTARGDYECENGTTVKNVAQVADKDRYVDGYTFADSTYGPVFRTITSAAFFCDRVFTPDVTQSYDYNCSPPTGGGGEECDSSCSGSFLTGETASIIAAPENRNECCSPSPIVLDILGNGINLTNAQNGVMFDFNGDGIAHRISWTSANSDDAWLVLDRNGNGAIDSSKEMFGNMTEQPASDNKNGFLALAEFDKTANGGNGDEVIDNRDAVFANLRLWQDTNHNGTSETSELKRLGELSLAGIELDYKESKRTDEHGNRFKYRAKVWDMKGAKISRWAWDVFLVVQPPND